MLSVAEVLQTEDARRAVADGDAGTVVRLVRTLATRLSQTELGAAIGYSQSMVSRIEQGRRCRRDMDVLRSIAGILGIPAAAVGLAESVFSVQPSGPTLSDVNRQEFLRAAAGFAASVALPRVVLAKDRPLIGAAEVRDCRHALTQLYEVDQQAGAGHVNAATTRLIRHVRDLLDATQYQPTIGRALREVAAAATENAGWVAFDAADEDTARRWWLGARHLADLDDLTSVSTVVLASMSLAAADGRRGPEAVQLARAARSADLTPRVQSLLAAREALGHAASGDKPGALREFAVAEKLFERGTHSDDPDWISFWGPCDFAAHQSKAAEMLGDYATTETLARAGLAAEDATRWERNHVLNGVRLGSVLTRRRAYDEAIGTLAPAVAAVGTISSGRLRRNLKAAVGRIAQQKTYRPAREFTAWAGQMLASA